MMVLLRRHLTTNAHLLKLLRCRPMHPAEPLSAASLGQAVSRDTLVWERSHPTKQAPPPLGEEAPQAPSRTRRPGVKLWRRADDSASSQEPTETWS